MGITKSNLFTREQNELAAMAKAFAHPARIAILQYLLQSDRCINSDLVTELGLAQATISQHLKELKIAGLIQGTISGASMNYCIHPENWQNVQQMFQQIFEKIETSNPGDCC